MHDNSELETSLRTFADDEIHRLVDPSDILQLNLLSRLENSNIKLLEVCHRVETMAANLDAYVYADDGDLVSQLAQIEEEILTRLK